MVVKYCPECKKTLAVACKTCPDCGYIFQAKKVATTKQTEKKSLDSKQRSERSRKESYHEEAYIYHELVKQRNMLYPMQTDKNQDVTEACYIKREIGANMEPQPSTPTLPTNNADSKKNTESVNSIETPPIKKRGRPKGSKDKQKRLPKGYKQLKIVRSLKASSDAEWEIRDRSIFPQNDLDVTNANGNKETNLYRKRGRPRGSKNKPSPMFYTEEDDDDFDSDDKDDRYSQIDEGFYIPADKKEKYSLILEDINQRITAQAFKV